MTEPQVERTLAERRDQVTPAEVVNAAIKFDLDGKRQQAIELLERHLRLGTDIQGTLGGRYKRLWLDSGDQAHARRSLEHYQGALDASLAASNHEQVYYHAINVAFLTYVVHNRKEEAARLARLALEHCAQSPRNVWRVATEAEAQLYLDQPAQASRPIARSSEWAARPGSCNPPVSRPISRRKLGDPGLQEAAPDPVHSGIPAHESDFRQLQPPDQDWLERLQTMMSPFLRKDELEVWDDTRLEAGNRWLDEIRAALASCKVAVLLVSKEFLASELVIQEELPVILTRRSAAR